MERPKPAQRAGYYCPNPVLRAPGGAISPGGYDGVHPIFQNRLRGLRVQRDSKLIGRAMGQGAGALVFPHPRASMIASWWLSQDRVALVRWYTLCALTIVRAGVVRVSVATGGAWRNARACDEPLAKAFKSNY